MSYQTENLQEGEEDKSTAKLLRPTSLELAGMSFSWVRMGMSDFHI